MQIKISNNNNILKTFCKEIVKKQPLKPKGPVIYLQYLLKYVYFYVHPMSGFNENKKVQLSNIYNPSHRQIN